MAGEVPPLNVEILVQLSNLTAAVTEATAGLNKIGNAAKEQEPKMSSLKSTMLGVFAGNLMAQGAMILEKGLHDAVKAIQDTQIATEQLSTAMNNAKQNTAANREEVSKSTEKMNALGFSVADSESALTKLVTATGSTTKATQMMSMAADLARYKHESLAEASATLVKGTMGNAKAFKEFGITLDATLPKNEAIAKAMDQLNGKIGGQAVGYTHTFAGEMEVLKAKFDDVAVKVGAVVLPILTKFLEFITNVLVPAIKFLYDATIGAWLKALINLWNTHEGLRKVIVSVIEDVIKVFGYLLGAIAKVVDTIAKIPVLGAPFKALGKGIDEAALSVGKFGSSLDGLANKKIVLPTLGSALATSGGTSTGGDSGISGGLGAAGDVVKGAASKAAAELANRNTEIKKYNDELIKLDDQMNTVLADRQDQMTKAKEANALAVQKIEKDNAIAVANIKQQAADRELAIRVTAANKENSIIQQSISLMTNAFESATKIDIGTLFTAGGDSATGLVDQLKDQLAKVLRLQKDAGSLAAQGYSQSFIDQVIAKGPDVGDQMAQAILNATPETASQMKDLYNQIDNVSQTGLDELASTMSDGTHLATVAMTREYAQVGIDLQQSLSENQAQLTHDLADQNTKYQAALVDAQSSFDASIRDINASINKQLADMQIKIAAARDALRNLGVLGADISLAATSSTGMTYATGSNGQTQALSTPTTGGGIVFNQNNVVNGNAAPAAIAASTLDMVKFGTPQIIAPTVGTATKGYVKM